MSSSPHALRRALSEAWCIRPTEPVTAVAARHLYLSPEYSAVPGYVDWARYPYLREPTDRLSPDDPCRTVVFLGPIQGGKTVIGQAFLASIVVQAPGPTLWVTDTDGKAESFSRKRLDLMARDDPTVGSLFAERKARTSDNTIKFKKFPGGDVKLVGAQSASGLTSDTVRYAIIDEADDHRANVSYAGSSIDLAMGRQTAYGALGKTLIVSSPKVRGESEIESWYLRGSQAHYYVPCPHCGEYQRLEWRDPQTGAYRLVWPEGHPEEALYFCPRCGCGIEEHQKNRMLPAGEWRAERPEIEDIQSYRLNALYLPVGAYSWVDMARQWEAATTELKRGSTDKHRTFVNTRLAETYEVPGDLVDAETLARRVEPAWFGLRSDNSATTPTSEYWATIPDEVRVISCGTDVQDDRVEVTTLGVGLGMEMWVLDYHVILSDPLASETWQAHDEVIRTAYRRASGGSLLHPAVSIIDSGHRTQQVYDYARTRARRGWRCHAIKGVPGKRPIWDKKLRKSRRYAQVGRFFAVGVDTIKDAMQGYLRIHRPGPGYVHIPQHVIDKVPDYLGQLASEKRVKSKDSKGRERYTWVVVSASVRNEAWDTLGYAIAGVHSLMLGGLRLEAGGAVRPQRAPSPSGPAPRASAPASAPLPDTTGAIPPAPVQTRPVEDTPRPRSRPPRPPRRGPAGGDWLSGGRPSRGGGSGWLL